MERLALWNSIGLFIGYQTTRSGCVRPWMHPNTEAPSPEYFQVSYWEILSMDCFAFDQINKVSKVVLHLQIEKCRKYRNEFPALLQLFRKHCPTFCSSVVFFRDVNRPPKVNRKIYLTLKRSKRLNFQGFLLNKQKILNFRKKISEMWPNVLLDLRVLSTNICTLKIYGIFILLFYAKLGKHNRFILLPF